MYVCQFLVILVRDQSNCLLMATWVSPEGDDDFGDLVPGLNNCAISLIFVWPALTKVADKSEDHE
jgi:hypothetical protein